MNINMRPGSSFPLLQKSCIRPSPDVIRLGRAMAQVVSRRPLTSEARVRARFNPCRLCSLKSGTGTVFLRAIRFSPVNISFHRRSPNSGECVIKAVPLHHGGAWWERRYSSYSFSTSALDGGEWSASRPGRGERTPGTHCIGGWVGPRAGLDTEVGGKILCPRRGSNLDRPVVQPVVRYYTAWATRLIIHLLPYHKRYIVQSLRKRRKITIKTIPTLALKISVKLAGLRAEIWTRDLLNTK
jgi:hypothetical protein